MIDSLTAKQRAEIYSTKHAMLAEGATREEIREAIDDLFVGWGIDRPERPEGRATQSKNRNNKNRRNRLSSSSFPNPFNPETVIEYTLDKEEQVSVSIFNINGKEVRSLVDDKQKAGTHSVIWNGTDKNGKQVPSGAYLYNITSDSQVSTEKILLLK
jgi:hypothetical protein